jgi:hypothetical protein
MPLTKSKSKKAFEHNIKAEISAGKPQKQAVAIAYAVKRKAHKADGGRFENDDIESDAPSDYSRRPLPSLDARHYDSDEDYYNARKAYGLSARPKQLTQKQKDEALEGYKKGIKAESAAMKEKLSATHAKYAKENAEAEKKRKAFVNENRKKSGLEPLKKGGAVKKHSNW